MKIKISNTYAGSSPTAAPLKKKKQIIRRPLSQYLGKTRRKNFVYHLFLANNKPSLFY